MKSFNQDSHTKVRLSDGSCWLVFEKPEILMNLKDWQSFFAIEILDQQNFEFLFLNKIELAIPRKELSVVSLNHRSLTAIIKSDYEKVVLT